MQKVSNCGCPIVGLVEVHRVIGGEPVERARLRSVGGGRQNVAPRRDVALRHEPRQRGAVAVAGRVVVVVGGGGGGDLRLGAKINVVLVVDAPVISRRSPSRSYASSTSSTMRCTTEVTMLRLLIVAESSWLSIGVIISVFCQVLNTVRQIGKKLIIAGVTPFSVCVHSSLIHNDGRFFFHC